MIHGKVRLYHGARYMKKPHFCPNCKTRLEVITVSKVAKNTEEARKYSRSRNRSVHFAGNVEYSWHELKCPSCSRRLTMEEIQKIEYEQMDSDARKVYERKERLKVVVFKVALFLFAALLIVGYILLK